jgi:regulator of replication initiation timing
MELPDDVQELKRITARLFERLSRLETENARLKAENEHLRRRLKSKNHNPHKPPSSDGLAKKPALTESSGKKLAQETERARIGSVKSPISVISYYGS